MHSELGKGRVASVGLHWRAHPKPPSLGGASASNAMHGMAHEENYKILCNILGKTAQTAQMKKF